MEHRVFFTFLLVLLFCPSAYVQDDLNLGFEKTNLPGDKPTGWSLRAPGYLIAIDSTEKHEGRYALMITSDPVAGAWTYAGCSQQLPAEYAGKTIVLSGYIKTENVPEDGTAWAGLWLRIDGENGVLAFDNMKDRPVTGTTGWNKYRIELPLEKAAHQIVFGALLSGAGKMWVDDLELLIDDKPPVRQVFPAELDSAFVHGSGIEIGTLSKRQILDLTLLGQIWGFLKYHHPAIAAGDHHWDFELFRVLPGLLSAKSRKKRDRYLLEWMDQLGEIPACDSCNRALPENAKLKPDLRWMETAGISRSLKAELKYIYRNRNQGKHYYVSPAPKIRNPIFQHEDAYEQFEYPDAGYRLLATYRYWNIIQYFFPYKHLIGEDWNAVLSEFIPLFVEANDALAYRLVALELIGRVHDTHANIWGKDDYLNAWYGKYFAPVQIKFIEGKAIVTDYFHPEWGPATGLIPGDQIIAVDGNSIVRLVEKKQKYYPASNQPTRLREMAWDLLCGAETEAELTYAREGREETISVKRYLPKELDLMINYGRQPDSCYHLLSDDIGYIYLGNIKNSLLPAIFEKFRDTKGIVIDIRNYPSESVVFSLGRYLMPEPTGFVKFTKGDIHTPGLFMWTPVLQVGEDNPDYYRGKVVILINEITQSQAEYTTMAFRRAPRATVIGSTTAGADGNVSRFYLPGKLSTMISGTGIYYPDGTETQRIGIVPDIEVKPTVEGIKAGRDELLEKAVELIMKEN